MTLTHTYGFDGTLRDDYMKDNTGLHDFHAMESDWRELFRWLMSVAGDIPFYDGSGREAGRLDSLWKDHVLVVLIEIACKDIDSYVSSFVGGKGTAAQARFTTRLTGSCRDWAARLERFVVLSHGHDVDSPAVQVAREIHDRLDAAIRAVGTDDTRHVPAFMDNRNQSYFHMLGTLEDIQHDADDYMARIEAGGDMDASLALLLVMVRNYSGIVSEFNGRLSDSAAMFYRREILHDTPRDTVPDRARIVIVPDHDVIEGTFSIAEGTLFDAGKAQDGTARLYAADARSYVVPATLSTVRTVYVYGGRLCTALLPSGGDTTAPLFPDNGTGTAELEYGWVVTSRSLVLSEGKRNVAIALILTDTTGGALPDLSGIQGSDVVGFKLSVSVADGWLEVPYLLRYDAECNALELSFTVSEDAPALSSCAMQVHGADTACPAARLLFADCAFVDSLPRGISIKSVRIRTEVTGISNFALCGDLGDIDSTQPFYPFGPLGECGCRLVFGHPDAAMKNIVGVSLQGVWNKLPERGFGEIYSGYGTPTPVDNSSFRVRCEWHDGESWRPCRKESIPLFEMDDNGVLCDRADMRLDVSNAHNCQYARRSGRYRITLAAPEMGFGVNEYYRLYTSVMMHNAAAKEKHRKIVPDMPSVPMLSGASFGYVTEETFVPESGGDSRLLAVSAVTGTCGCRFTETGSMPRLVPDIVVPSLVLGFSDMADTTRIRLYFNLVYIGTGDTVNRVACGDNGRMTIYVYGRDNTWRELSQEDIVCEETDGLTRSGFIEVKCPVAVDDDRTWLMLGFPEGNAPAGIAMEGIWLNCFQVTAINGDGAPLPAGSMVAPVEADSRIRAVMQPLPGYGGKPAEDMAASGIRSRVRISTRGRAVCRGDYEMLLLERFPEVAKVYCLPSDASDGLLSIVVFPEPVKSVFPLFPLWRLSEMERHVRALMSPFARVKVENAVYEPIDVYFRASVRDGMQDTGELVRRLKRMITTYFCSWLQYGSLPELGKVYSHAALLSRVGNDEHITQVIALEVSGAEAATYDGDVWYGPSDKAGVLYVRDISVELSDCSAGIDAMTAGVDFVVG